MSLILDDIALLYPDQLVLEFSPDQRDRAWEKTADFKYQDATSRWRAFLNALSSDTMTDYFKSDSNFRNSRLDTYPHSKEFPHLWKLINGVAITLNQTRLIIIPSEEIEAEELRVHQEWVDLSEWIGNYYLAAHVDLENCFLRISGFATHEQLSNQGHYDPFDKTYSLEITALTEDLSAIWVSQELFAETRPQVDSLPELSSRDAANLIQLLEYERPNILRLAIPFYQWGALFTNQKWRYLIYNYPEEKQQLDNLLAAATQQKDIIDVKQWFRNIFEAGWYSLEELIKPQSMNLAYNFRSNESPQKEGAQGVKLLELGPDCKNEVALIVKIHPKREGKIAVQIQLQSMDEENYLPSSLKLSLLSQSNKIIQEVQARDQDNLIQLKQFTCKERIFVGVQVTLGDLTLAESFKVGIP
ncbi:MAG: DUF1822 family protein [Cyanobacteria bacterium]|jgi:hypothetical protein|nr:DUF1822 family protein [Cyanobacteria bacterium GSL.Bin1]